MAETRLHPEWQALLAAELTAAYMIELRQFLSAELAAGKVIFPPWPRLFAALDATPPSQVKVVVLGQDPYHGEGQANGLSFSVPRGVPVPPSLRNIYKALAHDLQIQPPVHGDLSYWAGQGVLLLNTVLTVEKGKAGAHRGRGWEQFTDAVVAAVNDSSEPVVFMLWGRPAQQKMKMIDGQRHLVLQAPHPSPLSAHRGFIDCCHFSQANAFLQRQNRAAVDWQIPA